MTSFTNPNSGSLAAIRRDETILACPEQECPQVEIEINNTPDTEDDLVQLQCTHPARRHKVSCRIRRTLVCEPGSATIVLTNPDGRLRFPDAGDTTKTLIIPLNGDWVPFEISGETASKDLNDAVIEAHCNTATSALKGSKTVTVFWFDQAQITVTPKGNYRLTGGLYTAIGGNGVDYTAQARIRPAGVDCAAPQISRLEVGIMQNVHAGVSREKTWGTPTIEWNATVVPGTPVIVPTTIRSTTNLPNIANDCVDPSAGPLYTRSVTLSSLLLVVLMGVPLRLMTHPPQGPFPCQSKRPPAQTPGKLLTAS